VINAGVASYSPLLEYLYLQHGGLALQPDLVILNLDLSDVFDDIQYARLAEFNVDQEPIAVRAEPAREQGPWLVERLVDFKDLLKYQTRLYNFLKRRVGVYLETSRHQANFSGDVRVDKYGMLRANLGPQDDRQWTGTYDHILRIQALLKARNVDFWLSVYPYGVQVSPREWASGREFWGFQPQVVLPTRPQQLVGAFGRTHDIPVVDMSDDFKEASKTIFPLYYEGDGHWRAAGHRVAAAALHRALVPYLEGRSAQSADTPALRSTQRANGLR
jgi:SGNH hydrolase-like domain, acetyltransferase AlgX